MRSPTKTTPRRGLLLSGLGWLLLAVPTGARTAGDAQDDASVAEANADAPEERARIDVAVRVSATQGVAVFLDAGQEAGIGVGDRVQLSPLAGPTVYARIVSVTRTSARAHVDAGQEAAAAALEIGDEGVVQVPASRLRTQPPQEESPEATAGVPEHPPWTHPEVQWQEDVPLLAPAFALEPAERDRELRGRAFLSFDSTRDRASVDSEYTALRGGFDAELENPFGKGGGLQLDLAFSRRTVDVEDDGSSSDSLSRIERLSYRIGGVRGRPTRYEAGRFLHSEFPELGLVDGVEVVHRLANGTRVGASLGYLPEYDDDLGSGDDLAVSAFGRWVSGADERLALGGAVQKTWHEGEADRDLVIGTLDWAASETLSLRTSAWFDLFTSDDDLEDDRFALTRLNATGTWRPTPRHGLSLFVNRFDWPQLLRDEFEPVPDQGIRDYAVTRVGARGWTPLSENVRLSTRIDRWSDEEDAGTGAELSLGARDLLWDRGDFSASLRTRQGRFTDLTGLRLNASRALSHGAVSFRYDAAIYESSSDVEDALQHMAGVGWDWSFGHDWDLSVYGEARFGDDQDAQTLGLFLQRRF